MALFETIASVAAPFVGSLIGGSSVRNAARRQADAQQAAIDEQRRQFDLIQSQQEPWRQAGMAALNPLQAMAMGQPISLTAEQVMAEPGYQFALSEGQRALENSKAAGGGLFSGQTGKDLLRYGQNYATGRYNDAYNRLRNDEGMRWNRLASMAGIGQTATNQIGGAGNAYANAMGNIMASGANAQGAAGIAQGNIWGNAANQAISNIGRMNPGSWNWPWGNSGMGVNNTGTSLRGAESAAGVYQPNLW